MRDRLRRTWSELGRTQRWVVVALGTVQFGLEAAALVDLLRRDARDVRGPRWLWAAVSLVNFVGPIAYFRFGRRRPGR